MMENKKRGEREQLLWKTQATTMEFTSGDNGECWWHQWRWRTLASAMANSSSGSGER